MVNPEQIPRYAEPTEQIPRYAEPTEERVPDRTCENCGHSCELDDEDIFCLLCCCERDKIGRLGEVYIIHDDQIYEGCKDWEAL